eukprot:1160320-Pelagomonas_calceolata.AAC.5
MKSHSSVIEWPLLNGATDASQLQSKASSSLPAPSIIPALSCFLAPYSLTTAISSITCGSCLAQAESNLTFCPA